MAFDGHQSALENPLFQTSQRQTVVNSGGLNSGTMPMPFISLASKPEKDNTSYMTWSHNSQEDPYKFGFTQPNVKNRKPTDKADGDSEADLQGLVSNILDDADSRDSFFSESLPTCNPFWSPKTLREELLQYFKTEAKTLNNSSFPSNHLSHESFSKAQQHSLDKVGEELSQQSSGLAGNQQQLFNLPSGDNHSLRPQKLPPGLPVLKMMNTNPSLVQQKKYISMLPCIDRGNTQHLNSFPELSEIFRPRNEINGSSFDAFHDDQYTPSSVNPFCNENYVPEDVNQLVSSFQSFMPCEHDNICHEEFPNMYKQTLGLHKEQGFPEQWNITSPAMSTQSSPAMQIQKQLLGDVGSVQRGRIGEVRKKQLKLDAFQDLPNFSSQHTEYFQKPRAFSSHLNLTNHHQNKMAMQRENFNLNMNQYTKHQIQQNQMQAKIKSQLDREKRKMQMPGFFGEGVCRRQHTNTHMTEGDKQSFEQNLCFDFQENMQYQRLDGENTVAYAGNPQQFTPPLRYSVNDLRRYSSAPINSNFSSRSSLLCRNGVPRIDKSGIMSTNEAAAFNSIISDMTTYRGENTYHGMVSAMTASHMMNQGGPVMQFFFYLDECHEQWRSLEKDRKRTEIILKKTFPGKKTSVMTDTNLPRTPPNPTRVDQLLVNQMKEQAKVASLLDRMECCGIPLHVNTHTALKNHHMAVCIIQARCKEGSANVTKTQQQGISFTEERDNLLMAMALKDMSVATRRLRTALWCALQMTLPQPVVMQDHHAYEESTCTERCSFLFQGYSFGI